MNLPPPVSGPRDLVPEGGDEPLPEARRHPPPERATAGDALPRPVGREHEAGGIPASAHALLRFQDPPPRACLGELSIAPPPALPPAPRAPAPRRMISFL